MITKEKGKRMEEFVNIISERFPEIATVLTGVVFFIYFILNMSEFCEKVSDFIKKLFDVQKALDFFIYSHRRKKYDKTLSSDEFLKWQKEILWKIYNPLIEEKNNELKERNAITGNSASIKITEMKFDGKVYNSYESITLSLPPVDFPFPNICDKSELITKNDISKESYPDIANKFKKRVRKYYRLIESTIRYPKRLGYMLENIVISDEKKNVEWYIKAYVGNYENNLKSSHILEYELYMLYKRDKNKDIIKKSRKEILEKLPIRKYIHEQFINDSHLKEADILTSGKFRSSLLGVQMLVLVKNYAGSYDALRIRRSVDVVAKPGFLQFIPSGGFEAMNDCVDFDSQWDNYSIVKAVFRELLEECFGQDEDDKKASGNNISPDRIYSNSHIKELVNMLTNSKNQKASMQLLGSCMSLVGLRHELSFILKVDEPDFASMLIGNYESKSAIHLVDIGKLEDGSFWVDKQKERNDLQNLNCTSASLFELARNSQLYKSCLAKQCLK